MKLLVSVRSIEEADAAINGGADILDIKEPANGALGSAGYERIQQIAELAYNRLPVTAALGELVDFHPEGPLPEGVSVIKLGLAGAWEIDWRQKLTEINKRLPNGVSLAAVAYADYRAADSPNCDEVVDFAISERIPYFLLDTYKKSGRRLSDHVSITQMNSMFKSLQSNTIQTVLAGSLSLDDLGMIAEVAPSIVGVRTAVCEGGRQGVVSRQLVKSLKEGLASISQVANWY